MALTRLDAPRTPAQGRGRGCLLAVSNRHGVVIAANSTGFTVAPYAGIAEKAKLGKIQKPPEVYSDFPRKDISLSEPVTHIAVAQYVSHTHMCLHSKHARILSTCLLRSGTEKLWPLLPVRRFAFTILRH